MTGKPRMCLVVTTHQTVNLILRSQVQALSKEFELCLILDSPDLLVPSYARGVTLLAVPDFKRGISVTSDLRAIFHCIKHIRKFKPEITHSFTPKAGLVCALSAWVCRVPCRLHTFTGLIFPSESGFKGWVLRKIDGFICRLSTVVVAESLGVQRTLIREIKPSKEPIIIGAGNICGVDTDYYTAAASEQRDPAGPCRFLYAGRLAHDKGIADLVDAFGRLDGRSELHLIGEEDQRDPVDETVLDNIQRSNNIYLHGFKPDIRGSLANADYLILPSYREGFPNVVLQAMASGVPVISSRVFGAEDVVVDDITGWIFPIGDVEALARCMRSAASLCETERYRVMSKNCRQLMINKYDSRQYLESLLNFYSSLI